MEAQAAASDKPRILIVDDSRVIRVAAKRLLRDLYEVVEAGDGEEAWETLSGDKHFSVIISDLSMPRLDGMGLLQRLHGSDDPALRGIPFIIVTGAEDDDGARDKAVQAGASAYISKPFDPKELLACVAALADREEDTAAPTPAAAAAPAPAARPATPDPVDPVTGLPNRQAFLARGYRGVAQAILNCTELALALIAIDDFANLRARCGDSGTNSLLASVADMLRARIRREDCAARIGDDRFALLLPSASPAGARRLAQRLNQDISQRHFDHDGRSFRVTVSAAVVAPSVRRDTRFDHMMRDAERRLEQAVAAGGNRVVHRDEPMPISRPAAERPVAPARGAPAAAADTDSNNADAAAQLASAAAGLAASELEAMVRHLLPLFERWNEAGNHGLQAALAEIRSRLQPPG